MDLLVRLLLEDREFKKGIARVDKEAADVANRLNRYTLQQASSASGGLMREFGKAGTYLESNWRRISRAGVKTFGALAAATAGAKHALEEYAQESEYGASQLAKIESAHHRLWTKIGAGIAGAADLAADFLDILGDISDVGSDALAAVATGSVDDVLEAKKERARQDAMGREKRADETFEQQRLAMAVRAAQARGHDVAAAEAAAELAFRQDVDKFNADASLTRNRRGELIEGSRGVRDAAIAKARRDATAARAKELELPQPEDDVFKRFHEEEEATKRAREKRAEAEKRVDTMLEDLRIQDLRLAGLEREAELAQIQLDFARRIAEVHADDNLSLQTRWETEKRLAELQAMALRSLKDKYAKEDMEKLERDRKLDPDHFSSVSLGLGLAGLREARAAVLGGGADAPVVREAKTHTGLLRDIKVLNQKILAKNPGAVYA